MVNECNFSLRATGQPANVKEFIRIFQHTDTPPERRLYRIFKANLTELSPDSVQVTGICAWSVSACMLEGERTYYSRDIAENPKTIGTSLLQESKRLQLDIEVYGAEPGVGFEEHYIIRNGELIVQEVLDLEQINIKEFRSVDELNKKFNVNLSLQQYEDHEIMHIGGFENWTFTI